MNEMNAGLSIEIKHEATAMMMMREHRNEVFGRNPFEEMRFRGNISEIIDISSSRMEQMGKIEISIGAVEPGGGLIVGHGGLFGGGEGAEPEPGALLGLADLGDPLAPSALADAAVLAGGVERAAFATGRTLLPWLIVSKEWGMGFFVSATFHFGVKKKKKEEECGNVVKGAGEICNEMGEWVLMLSRFQMASIWFFVFVIWSHHLTVVYVWSHHLASIWFLYVCFVVRGGFSKTMF